MPHSLFVCCWLIFVLRDDAYDKIKISERTEGLPNFTTIGGNQLKNKVWRRKE
jgi:hypothetical protein